MAVEVEITDNTMEIINATDEEIISWLYEAAGEVKSQAMRNSRVDTGELKGSWTYVVDEDKKEATIGSPLENAIWEEFGTGHYALNGNGRKKPWGYTDRKGVFHWTHGKKPNRTLFRAWQTCKGKMEKSLTNKLKGIIK